jgi:hypothetical protein
MLSRRIRFAILGLVALVLLGTGVAVAGGEADPKLRTGERVVIGADEIVGHDLYAFAGTVVVEGIVEGDLVAGAGTVTVNGTVTGDLIAGAGQVFIGGVVEGDVRAGAGEVTVAGEIGEDLLVASGRILVTAGGTIGEDLIFSGGQVQIDGSVGDDIRGTAGEYSRSGSVGGTEDVIIEAGTGPDEPDEPSTPVEEATAIAGDAIRQWVSVILLGSLALLLAPGALRASESALRRRPLAAAGMGIGVVVGYLIGFIALILLTILAAIALGSITLDGLAGVVLWGGILTLLVATFHFVVAAVFLVDAVVGLAIGQLAGRGWATSRWHELALLIVGSFFVVLVTNLPVIGPIAKLVVIVLGFGAMAVAVGEWWTRGHPPTPVAFPAATPAGPAAPVVPPAAPSPPAPAPTAAPATAPPAGAPPPPADAPVEPPAPAEPPSAASPPAKPRATRARKPKAPPAEPPS